jgi:hypothetical protein
VEVHGAKNVNFTGSRKIALAFYDEKIKRPLKTQKNQKAKKNTG